MTRRLPLKSVTAMLGLSLVLGVAEVHSGPTEQAKKIHERLTGALPSTEVVSPATQSVLQQMETEIGGTDSNSDGLSGGVGAAYIAMEHQGFYGATIKNWVAPWTNRDQDVFVPFNDYSATVIGFIEDDLDFRGILYSNLIGVSTHPDAPAYSTVRTYDDENDDIVDHYEFIERNNHYDTIELQAQTAVTGLPLEAVAGVMTTHAAAKAFFIDGTNRAMLRFTMLNHMCRDLEQVQDTSRSPDRIRQDVSRSPGGDSRVFLNNCISCHSGMDPLAQAFAYYDYENPEGDGTTHQLVYNDVGDVELDEITNLPVMEADDGPNIQRVQSKYYNNNNTFAAGYVTPDNSWENYWRAGPNSVLGWNYAGGAPVDGKGEGAESLGRELAHSKVFAQCQVQKVFKTVCLRDPVDAQDLGQLNTLTGNFESNGYRLKQLFAETADYCKGA
ncbi:MAG: hypothetical protein ACRBCI_11415 [Cellvibrionaceae bacterium]